MIASIPFSRVFLDPRFRDSSAGGPKDVLRVGPVQGAKLAHVDTNILKQFQHFQHQLRGVTLHHI